MYKYNTSMGCTYINVARLTVSDELSHDVSNTLQKKKVRPVNHDAGYVAAMNGTGTYIMHVHVLKCA